MEIRQTTIYICEFCRKAYQKEHFAKKHEKLCSKNLANWRPCHSCPHLEKMETEIYLGIDDYFDGEPLNKKVSFLHCFIKDIFLYTPQNEIKGNYKHLDNEGNNFKNYPMPKKCDKFDSNFNDL